MCYECYYGQTHFPTAEAAAIAIRLMMINTLICSLWISNMNDDHILNGILSFK